MGNNTVAQCDGCPFFSPLVEGSEIGICSFLEHNHFETLTYLDCDFDLSANDLKNI